jgi:hypothetical protein
MTIRYIASFTVGFLLVAQVGTLAEWQPVPFHQFTIAVEDYTALHQRLEQQVPPLRVSEHARDIFQASDILAAAIQASRSAAREGDIFTPTVAAYFRARISDTLSARGFRADELVSAMLEESDETSPLPVVNGRFPHGRGTIMWPCILEALPKLPDELQYRMIGSDLILVDTHADLVVDILRQAAQ